MSEHGKSQSALWYFWSRLFVRHTLKTHAGPPVDERVTAAPVNHRVGDPASVESSPVRFVLSHAVIRFLNAVTLECWPVSSQDRQGDPKRGFYRIRRGKKVGGTTFPCYP